MTALAPEQGTEESVALPASARSDGRAGQLFIALALVSWLVALPSVGSARLSQFGLLATASPLFITAIALNVIAFVLSVRARRFAESVVALTLMVVVQRLTTTLGTSVPLYSWTYKHLGVVDYIQHHGQLAHGLDVYQGWPGLFAVTGWFSDITGVAPMTIAHWFTPGMHLALIGLVYAVARTWGLDAFAALVASFLVESLNWVAQDYYSPQATALIMAAGFVIVLGLSRQKAVATPLAIVIFGAIVVTHQLTPYWLIIAVISLTLTKRVKPRWLIFAMVAMAGAYLAFNYRSISHFSLLSFNPIANAQSNVPTIGVVGQRLTSLLVRTLSVVLWSSTVVCALIQRRQRIPVLGRVIVAFSGFLLLGGQGYGGEAIFRVFLYSLIGSALVIAPVLTKAINARPSRATVVAFVLVGAVAASAQGFFGGWFANRMSRSEVDEAQTLLNSAPLPSYITVAAPVWPERPTGRYVAFSESTLPGGQAYDYPMIYEAKLTGTDFSNDASYQKFIVTAGGRAAPTYLIITRQMAIYDWYFGILPLNALDNLQQRLRVDPRWTVYKTAGDYVIYKSTPLLYGVK